MHDDDDARRPLGRAEEMTITLNNPVQSFAS